MAQPGHFDLGTVMGADLRRVMPAFRASCSMSAIRVITEAVEAKGQARFAA